MSENNEHTLTTRDELADFLLYTAPDGQVKVECILHDETIWLTQDRIAELFGVQRPAITLPLMTSSSFSFLSLNPVSLST